MLRLLLLHRSSFDLTPGFNELGRDNFKTKRETLRFGAPHTRGLTISVINHIMACRLVGTKPLSEPMLEYIVNLTPGNKFQWNINRNSYIFIQENAYKNVVCEMPAILSLLPCENTATPPGPMSWLLHSSGISLGMRPAKWETSLHYNDVSHWLGAYLDWLNVCPYDT